MILHNQMINFCVSVEIKDNWQLDTVHHLTSISITVGQAEWDACFMSSVKAAVNGNPTRWHLTSTHAYQLVSIGTVNRLLLGAFRCNYP